MLGKEKRERNPFVFLYTCLSRSPAEFAKELSSWVMATSEFHLCMISLQETYAAAEVHNTTILSILKTHLVSGYTHTDRKNSSVVDETLFQVFKV